MTIAHMMKTRAASILLLIGPLFALLAGRAWGQEAPASAPASAPVSIESARAELLEMAKQVQSEVEEIRGWKFKQPVRTDVRTEEQLRSFIERKVFDEQLAGSKLQHSQAFLRTIGLIPHDCDLRKTIMDVLLNQIGGFYDPDTKSFYMLHRSGVQYGKLLSRALIAHELCHALDDQYVDLTTLIKKAESSEDAAFAIGAVIEGSATHLMTVHMTKAMQAPDYDADELSRVLEDEMARSQLLQRVPRYFTTILFNYVGGMFFITRNDPELLTAVGPDERKCIQENVMSAAKNPPRSSEQVLHPHKYWDPAQADEPIVVNDDSVRPLIEGSGRFVVYSTTVGEVLCALLASDPTQELSMLSAGTPTYWTNESATGWGGDRFFLLSHGADAKTAGATLKSLQAVWVTAWDSADDREEFVSDYNAISGSDRRRSFNLGARGAVFLYGFDAAEAQRLEARFRESTPRFERDGQRWTPD